MLCALLCWYGLGGFRSTLLIVLLQNTCDVNLLDAEGCTALHRAIAGGHLEVMKFLLKNEANVDVVNGSGLTPLDLAKYVVQVCERQLFLCLRA